MRSFSTTPAPGTMRRALLREATRPLHEMLDAMARGRDLRERTEYAALLLEHAAALAPLETRLELSDVESVLPDWKKRRRRAALGADLAGLGHAFPVFEAPGTPFTRDEVFGTLYVLEGARLGGDVMARLVAGSMSAAVRSNARYLTHGRASGLWTGFLARLEAAPDLAMASVVAAAEAAFTAFIVASRAGSHRWPDSECLA